MMKKLPDQEEFQEATGSFSNTEVEEPFWIKKDQKDKTT